MFRLLRNTPRNQPVLFFYRNRPCVVIGRNQASLSIIQSTTDTPWIEELTKPEPMERDRPSGFTNMGYPPNSPSIWGRNRISRSWKHEFFDHSPPTTLYQSTRGGTSRESSEGSTGSGTMYRQ